MENRDQGNEPVPPTFSLPEFKSLAKRSFTRSTTPQAFLDAQSLGMESADIWRCIERLKASDFYKTMPSVVKEGLWQDVYRTRLGKLELYVKIQILPGPKAHVISFKEL